MRFIRTELSPANKKQYLIALGRKDIELLIGEAVNAARYTPTTREQKDEKRRLRSIAKTLGEALAIAEQDGDEGDRLPLEERQIHKNRLDANPLAEINRLEIIDHRPCDSCNGEGWIHIHGSSERPQECPACHGGGSKGREVIVGGPAYGHADNVEISSSVQDQGRTLKLIISEREK